MRRKTKRRRIAFFACLVLVVMMIMGCSQTKNDEIEEENLTEDSVNLYGFENPITIKVGLDYASDFQWVGGESPENNSWMELYHENNIFPEILYMVDISQKKSKLQAAILSGNYPDLIQTEPAEYLNYVKDGVLADITEAYDTYASKELKNYLMTDGGRCLESLKVDGKLYGLPRLGDPYEECSVIFIREDWLDRLGLPIPETMEDLKKVAYAFTYDDPDGNGVQDTYGIAMNGVSLFSNTFGDSNPIFESFGVYFGADGMAMIEQEDGSVVWGGSNVDGMKEALSFLQEVYANGSLSKDFLTMDSTVVYEEAGEGRCGIWFGPTWAGMIPAINAMAKDENSHVIALPILKGINAEEGKAYLANPLIEVHCISSQCENPEALIKMMNLGVQKICNPANDEELKKYKGDNDNYSGWKASLLHLKPVDGGYKSWMLEQQALKTGNLNDLNVEQRQEVENILAFREAKKSGTLDINNASHTRGIANETLYGDEHCGWAVIDEMVKKDAFVQSANPVLPSEKVTEVADTLKNLTVETLIKIITGDSIDEYDAFLEDWYALGGEIAVEEANIQK